MDFSNHVFPANMCFGADIVRNQLMLRLYAVWMPVLCLPSVAKYENGCAKIKQTSKSAHMENISSIPETTMRVVALPVDFLCQNKNHNYDI